MNPIKSERLLVSGVDGLCQVTLTQHITSLVLLFACLQFAQHCTT